MEGFDKFAGQKVEQSFSEHEVVLVQCRRQLLPAIVAVAEVLMRSIQGGGKIMLCGNGGSAADSQHIAAG